MDHALEFQPASHIVRRDRKSEVRGELGFLPRLPFITADPLENAQGVSSGLAEQDDIVLVLEPRIIPDRLDIDIIIGNPHLVERDPRPTLVLGGLPGMHQGDPRDNQIMDGNVGHGGDSERHDFMLLAGRGKDGLQVFAVLVGPEDEASRVELLSLRFEGLFSYLNLQVFLFE